MNERILTVKEVSAYLRIHPSTTYRLIKRHQLPHFRIGKDHRFDREAIDRWIAERGKC